LPDRNELFVTEKVLKCFVGLHPFLYAGFRGGLGRLRLLGFQTFHPTIDESYDAEPHGPTRLIKAIDELRRLAAIPRTELEQMYETLWPRLEHNARHACVESAHWGKALLEREVRQPLLAFGASG
jgi:hypothetical protein